MKKLGEYQTSAKYKIKKMKENQSIPSPPKPPLSRVIREGTIGTCPKCHSTEEKKYNFLGFSWGEILGCINTDCKNYYKK